MLKITNTEAATEQHWILCGHLAGPWAAELLSHWEKSPDARSGRKCVVDLSDVTFIDEAGERVLAAMREAGAHFLVRGVDTEDLIENLGVPEKRSVRRCIAHLREGTSSP